MDILPQIAQRTQRNAAWLHYFAEKDRLEIVLFWGLGFVCDYQRDLRETLGFLLSTLTCYSPADSADLAEECSMAVLFRRERQVGDGCEIIAVIVVLLFVFCLRKSAKSAGDIGV